MPAQRAIAEADPFHLLDGEAPILIDQWQRVPAVWDTFRWAVVRGIGKPTVNLSRLLRGDHARIAGSSTDT